MLQTLGHVTSEEQLRMALEGRDNWYWPDKGENCDGLEKALLCHPEDKLQRLWLSK